MPALSATLSSGGLGEASGLGRLPATRPEGAADLLRACRWWCAPTEPGAAEGPESLAAAVPVSARLGFEVPGTAAGALRDAGVSGWYERDLDNEDWWFVTTVELAGEGAEAGGPALLEIGGLATFAEVFWNGSVVASSSSMFVPLSISLERLAQRNELAICCRALLPRLDRRAGRGRWRNTLVERQALRAVRTSLLGRISGWSSGAAPVGPWRPVKLWPGRSPALELQRLDCRLEPAGEGSIGAPGANTEEGRDAPRWDGIVEIEARLGGLTLGARSPEEAREQVPEEAGDQVLEEAGGQVAVLQVGEARAVLEALPAATAPRPDSSWLVRGTLRLPGVSVWWPHTHGEPACYRASLRAGGEVFELGLLGFRTVEADRRDGGFSLVVNGVPVFARGACWVPPDPISLAAGPEATRDALEQLRRAGCNLVRVMGSSVYEDEPFFAACDELGILVWQDCMLANLDPPEDETFVASLDAELTAALRTAARHPSLAVICGGSEIEQQAAMSGLGAAQRSSALLERHIPALAAELAPGVPYLTSTPTGGTLPFRCDRGVAHYFGVGAYLRPLEDARRAGVRFAAECLAFSVPPEPATVDELLGGVSPAGHDPRWKRGVPRDSGTSWDFEDVRDHYVGRIFGVDPRLVRYSDPARSLELGRAAVAECFSAVISEWRRPGSGCAGAVVLAARDLVPGAGWGIVDCAGRPKAPWYVLRRLLAPVALLATDEGLNGWRLHVVNDTSTCFEGRLELSVWREGELLLEQGACELELPARGGRSLDAAEILGGFRDLTYAYRFGPPGHDVVLAELHAADGSLAGEAVLLPGGLSRSVEADLGLAAELAWHGGGWTLRCSCRRFACWVAIEADGYEPLDSWFHLVPGRTRIVGLRPLARLPASAEKAPRVELRALNLSWPVRAAAIAPGRPSEPHLPAEP